MKIVSVEILKDMFGPEIPAAVYQFMLGVPDDTTDEQMHSALQMFAQTTRDPRVIRGLAVAKKTLALDGKTFEESYSKEMSGQLMSLVARVLVAVFQDMDATRTHHVA